MRYLLPLGTELGDPCPYCYPSAHHGVWSPERDKWMVCMVCGDRGKIDKVSLVMYGQEGLTNEDELV
jgi:hypothetical protein